MQVCKGPKELQKKKTPPTLTYIVNKKKFKKIVKLLLDCFAAAVTAFLH
jgi:hypothetical protein